MSATTSKVCRVCHKDVSNAKRVKDPQGHYYCVECHAAASRQTSSGSKVAVPMATSPGKAIAAEKSAFPPAEGPTRLPEFCPNCGAKVFPNRKLCIKCNRDVTKMEKVIAMKAEEAAGPTNEEKIAIWVSRITKVGLAVAAVVVVVVVLWGYKLMFMPGGLWDNYPKNREAAVREFLGDIADGGDRAYDKAFMLISFRERSTNQENEDKKFKLVFARMHSDFEQKYGRDWLKNMKLTDAGSNDQYADDEVDFKLALGNDTYTIATQVQIDVTQATANMTLPRYKKKVYKEDGQNRFGILDVAEYLVHPKRHMVEMVGPGQPETLELPPGVKLPD